ncbi:MAG TPA: dihydrofolate reductase family protein [Longimicrobiales bacterium]|nr:dihydrofolate reductase family protein [Longimicrobiales bacterium]
MARLRIASFSVSLDGFGAGPDQSLDAPLGIGGERLHRWAFETRTFREMVGKQGGGTGTDDHFMRAGFENVGAWILGRNMFGPVRGPWPDDSWKGWWGDVPPYHTDVYVLTHHPREPLPMAGGTTFHFVTDGIHAALRRARESAGDMDVRLGGGPGVIRQYLQAGLVDEIHLAVAPVILGRGEPLFTAMDLAALGYSVTRHEPSPYVMHTVLARRSATDSAAILQQTQSA